MRVIPPIGANQDGIPGAEAMSWATLLYTREQVDIAGRLLISKNPQEVQSALPVVNNWRTSHAFPLNALQMLLRQNVKAVNAGGLVAQRTKRLPAIAHKIERLNRLKLSEFQDIVGCRAIMPTISDVYALRLRYSRSKMAHILRNETDYLASPRKTGYRGIHLIYEYRATVRPEFSGFLVEMQLRSRLQHAWATAVETVGMFQSQYLKSNQGDPQWLRFFVLMSAAIAHREGAAPVPGAPTDPRELKAELKEVASAIDARRLLMSYGKALSVIEPTSGDLFLLKLTAASNELEIKTYLKKDLPRAQAEYLEVEKESMGAAGVDAVLVSVDTVKQLRTAYPNYYLDTRLFVNAFDTATGRAVVGTKRRPA